MRYIIKDITTVEAPAVIIHGVNCQRAMGSGVAKALYEKWPIIREWYLASGSMELGDIQIVNIGNDIMVINCFTQHKFGTDGDKYANAESLHQALEGVARFAKDWDYPEVYSPRIGCGLGGLDWKSEVLPVFQEIEKSYPTVEFIICDLN